ncbi:Deazaflavin-dependent oxidoreductase, nitroreductase family OS=Tsukamurella paurometabola (strain ATCC 8368 / DSM / CCUG 35730 / CIP 100753 / JCM 10117/ KCTC 9821 / NBRC 16120 / NCIMB 702349 / NCTC 13040) OX=521096 GN=Tpau_1106 PE=4 SV=1 [Tsukamurella paurometabola]|uniref:Deazaflavin-dependent oxidoreductase, nitroreductase family n=2 Tax=Tsukamurella paurometabola TaxID=2061 RepID=D5UVE8_TSUPD|nr:conserved hypothetical protein [Tsukamurella paurometabola DSM 20162]SUP28563.1 Deazaflavin-dependent nitroreductase [Tsukamurella paurometabola]
MRPGGAELLIAQRYGRFMGRISDLLSALATKALQTRALARAPIWLYRHDLGALLGGRMVLIEHTGRTTGEPRYAVVEVVDRPGPDEVIVCSGFGERAQWYRNLRATPECALTLGRHRRPAHADLLDREASDQVLERYQRSHPAAWRRLRGAIEQATGAPVESLPMVRFTLN